MEKINKEKLLTNYPKPISIKGTEIILKQMKECICKIYLKDGTKGTGFFCNIKYKNKNIKIMITNNHIIDDKYIKENDRIEITLNYDKEKDDDKDKRNIILNNNRKIYTNKEYDTTIIEIYPEKDKIYNYMDIDDRYTENSNIIYEKSIYIIQYPLGEKIGVSYGIINNIDKYNIEHYCSTYKGSSGSPILDISNNKIIGIHIGGEKEREINRGILLIYPINDILKKENEKNEIEIILKIKK